MDECPCCGNVTLNEPIGLNGMECAYCGTRWCWEIEPGQSVPDFMLPPDLLEARRAARRQRIRQSFTGSTGENDG